MAHVREQVCSAVDTLLSASPTNWNEVFQARLGPSRDVMPYLLVYVESEDVTALDIHSGHLQQRNMNLTVKGRYRNDINGETLEQELNAIATEIETTLTVAALKTELGGKLKQLLLSTTVSDPVVAEDESRTFAEIALDWQVQVHTVEGDPETLV